MKIAHNNDDVLVITDFPVAIGVFGFSLSLLCGSFVVYNLAVRSTEVMKLFTGCVASLIFFAGAAAFAKRCVFCADKRSRRVHYSRRGLFERTLEQVDFDDVSDVVVERTRTAGSHSYSYRVALVVGSRRIPIAQRYRMRTKDECENVARLVGEIVLSN